MLLLALTLLNLQLLCLCVNDVLYWSLVGTQSFL